MRPFLRFRLQNQRFEWGAKVGNSVVMPIVHFHPKASTYSYSSQKEIFGYPSVRATLP